MKLDGIHHVTCITADATRNRDYYTGVLGLRLVKKSVNQDDTSVYHLFYADAAASPGADITFFAYPGARPGRAGDGMVHTVVFRVGSDAAVDFWAGRLGVERDGDRVRFADPDGLALEIAHVETGDEPLTGRHPEIPAEHALQGFDGVRAYSSDPERSDAFLREVLEFEEGYEVRGSSRGSFYVYDAPPAERGVPGAGTVHHVAWSSEDDEHAAWQERVAHAGAHPTGIIDRFYFRSIYFREPSGVLFEIATHSPGFAADEPLDRLGEKLALPPFLEHMRAEIEAGLPPL
ncbi:MAG: ring-cleaving dioxygenase [Gemmatimonadota bacterium]